MTKRRPGPEYESGEPYYCPWCHEFRSGDEWYDHSFEHRGMAPKAHLIIEEYYPVALAKHAFAEGL